MRRFLPPSLTLVLVTGLLVPYGSQRWSWLAGPIASLAIWALDRVAHEPAAPAPARARARHAVTLPTEPEPS